MQEQETHRFSPDEELAVGSPVTPEDTPEEKGEGDEWVKTGAAPEAEQAEE